MFLTTNRVRAIDDAFLSRVHLSVSYPPLTPTLRGEIWKTFARQNLPPQELSQWMNHDLVAEVSNTNANGRQIKNAVRVAHALARNEGRTLTPDDVRTALRTLQSYSSDLSPQMTRKRGREDDEDTGRDRLKRTKPIVYEDDVDEHDDDDDELSEDELDEHMLDEDSDA